MVQVSEYLARNLGWHFPPDRWRDLERGLREIARSRNFDTTDSCIDWILSTSADRERTEALAVQFTVGETYFNREVQSLEALEQHVLPDLIRSRRGSDRRLRIWSAGCCTGEEPYSIAMLLDRMIPDLDRWNISILGTDINPCFLEKARAGIYSQWSFRGASPQIKDSYFRPGQGSRLEILPRLKRMVSLRQFNLADETPSLLLKEIAGMDLILCRNVLIYFSPAGAATVLDTFYHSLSAGGWLVVSQTETALIDTRCFATINFPGAVLFRRLESDQELSVATNDYFHLEPQPEISSEHLASLQSWSNNQEVAPFVEREIPGPPAEESGPVVTSQPLTEEEQLLLYRQGRYPELETVLLNLANGPDSAADSRVMVLLAKVLANQGRYDGAREWIERAIAVDKLDACARYLQATILQELGRLEDALWALNCAIYLEPNFVIAHFSLGNLMLKTGGSQEGKRSLVTALALLGIYAKDALIPESDGLSAGRLTEIITSMISKEVA